MKTFFAAARLILTLKCEHSTKIVSESLDRDLSMAERWAVRLHAIGCWSCRRFGHQMRQLREAMRLHPERESVSQLSKEAMQRIKTAIRQASSD